MWLILLQLQTIWQPAEFKSTKFKYNFKKFNT